MKSLFPNLKSIANPIASGKLGKISIPKPRAKVHLKRVGTNIHLPKKFTSRF